MGIQLGPSLIQKCRIFTSEPMPFNHHTCQPFLPFCCPTLTHRCRTSNPGKEESDIRQAYIIIGKAHVDNIRVRWVVFERVGSCVQFKKWVGKLLLESEGCEFVAQIW